jgi:uncharacterized protein
MSHPVVYFEIGCKDKAKTSAFYRDVFNWKTDDRGAADHINTGSTEGIQGHITALGHEPHNFLNFYIQTPDLAASLKKVAEHGGKTIVPPVDVGNGTFAWFADIEGTIVGLWTPK